MQEQLARDLLEQFISGAIAGSPSFDIRPGGGGDARRSRKGLSPTDVQRLIEANPEFGDQIREMYLPGPSLPAVRKADMGSDMMMAEAPVPVGEDPRLPMSQDAFRQLMMEKMRGRMQPAPQQPYGNPMAEYLIRGA